MFRRLAAVVAAGSLVASLPAQSRQEQFDALLRRAAATSELNAGVPTFQLAMNLVFHRPLADGATDGSYLLEWSGVRWRAQFAAGSYVEQQWFVDGTLRRLATKDFRPEETVAFSGTPFALAGPELFHVLTQRNTSLTPKKLENPKEQPNVACVSGKQHAVDFQICFDSNTGAVVSQRREKKRTEFSDFQAIGLYLWPRSIRVFDGTTLIAEARLKRLDVGDNLPAEWFRPPAEAELAAYCSGKYDYPRAISMPDPEYTQRGQESTVILAVRVDAKGRVAKAGVTRSGGGAFDQSAIAAVRRWTFNPATCDGKPTTAEVNVEVNFRTFP